MSIVLHWYLPAAGDGRTLLEANRAVATPEHLVAVARAAQDAGFDAVLTPTGTWCDDAWITTAALSQHVDRLRFLVAFRPGTVAPMLAAQQAATFHEHTRGRLLLNIVTGGEDAEQRRYGDRLNKDERYARTDEFLTVPPWRLAGDPFDFHGRHLWVEGALAPALDPAPRSTSADPRTAALRVAVRHADVYLTWGEPPPAVARTLDRVQRRWPPPNGRDAALRDPPACRRAGRTPDEAWRDAEPSRRRRRGDRSPLPSASSPPRVVRRSTAHGRAPRRPT